MSEREKRFAIVGAIVLLIIALFFLFRKGSTVYQGGGNVTLGDVIAPGSTFNRQPFNIPGLTVGPEWSRLSAIGACCTDCQKSAPMNYAPASPGVTLVFNEANKGGTSYNYFSPPPSPSYGGTWYRN